MARRSKTLKGPYSAYNHRRVDEDVELTHVGRDTACGEYLRRYWLPVALSTDLGDVPLAVRIMGEDLVLFRDLSGAVGLLERHCCHRGTSLEFGRIRERGIQCCYHGWHFDVDGKLLDTPVETPEDRPKRQIYQGAYPARDHHGLIFAYMGPPDRKPDFPDYDFFASADVTRIYYKRFVPCNWIQIRDNEVDISHGNFLHTVVAGEQLSIAYHTLPLMNWVETPIGSINTQTRRLEDRIFVRLNEYIMPSLIRIAGIEDGEGVTSFDRRGAIINWCVPIDDTESWVIGWNTIERDVPHRERDGFMDRLATEGVDPLTHPQLNFQFGQDGDRPYEDRQRVPGDWDAFVSQGPIAIHGNEHLLASDRGVAMFRRLVREGIRAVADGDDPKGVFRRLVGPIRTHAHNTAERVPTGATPDQDREVCLEFERGIIAKTLAGAAGEGLDAREA